MDLKRTTALVLAAGVCFSMALAGDGDKAKDAMKDVQKQAQDAATKAQDAAKKAADDAKKAMDEKKPAAPDMGADPKMAEMMASMTPGEHHAHLAKFAGDWDVKSKMWMEEGAPPMESTAVVTAKMEMGGRFLYIHYNGDMMGQPFKGVSMMGYNNNSKQHESVWVDNMSTGIWYSTGSCSADGKTYTLSGIFTEPDGTKKTTREVTSWTGADTYTMEFYETPGEKGGKERKMMELAYTRKGGGHDAKPEIKAPEMKKPEMSK
jgi:hypothetical protein